MKKRNSYRVRNWSEYNAGLKQRGSLTFWLNDAGLTAWYNQTPTGRRGASCRYSDMAIETVMTLKSIYHLAGRQAVGLVESIFQLMGVRLTVPEHSTLSRCLSGLAVCLPGIPKTGARHVVVDATGVKIYGEGAWQTRQHGVNKRRPWRKLHLAVDEQTGDEVSHNDQKDSQLLEGLLAQIKEDIDQVSAGQS